MNALDVEERKKIVIVIQDSIERIMEMNESEDFDMCGSLSAFPECDDMNDSVREEINSGRRTNYNQVDRTYRTPTGSTSVIHMSLTMRNIEKEKILIELKFPRIPLENCDIKACLMTAETNGLVMPEGCITLFDVFTKLILKAPDGSPGVSSEKVRPNILIRIIAALKIKDRTTKKYRIKDIKAVSEAYRLWKTNEETVN